MNKENGSDFDQELYNKYFQSSNDYSFNLTKEEQEYLKNITKLKGVYIEEYRPLQYYDSNINTNTNTKES